LAEREGFEPLSSVIRKLLMARALGDKGSVFLFVTAGGCYRSVPFGTDGCLMVLETLWRRCRVLGPVSRSVAPSGVMAGKNLTGQINDRTAGCLDVYRKTGRDGTLHGHRAREPPGWRRREYGLSRDSPESSPNP
jgi:hypothetical protein